MSSAKELQDHIQRMLVLLGENPAREGLLKTPERVAESLQFLTQGYAQDVEKTLNGAVFREDYKEMVLVRDIDFFSLCERRHSRCL